MRILLILSVIYAINCWGMEIQLPINPKEVQNVAGVQLLHAIKMGRLSEVREITQQYPHVINSSFAMPIFYNDTVFPVHVAAAYGRYSCLEYLLSCDADPNSLTGKMKNSPLHFARTAGIARLLSQEGGRADRENEKNIMPLCNILFVNKGGVKLRKKCAEERYEIADALWQNDPRCIHVPNARRRTPLHEAVLAKSANSLLAVDFLLQRGADPTVLDWYKKSPFDYAIQDDSNPEMVQLFAYHGLFFFRSCVLLNCLIRPIRLHF